MNTLPFNFTQKILAGAHSHDLDPFEFGNDTPTVKQLLRYEAPIPSDMLSIHVLDRFINDQSLFSLTVVDGLKRPVGLIDRGRITEFFIKQYARDLYHKQKIREIMTTDPIIVDVNTSIDDLAQIIIDSGMQHMMHGFIIVKSEVYAGMATGHALLEEITHRKQRDLYYLAHYDQLTGLPNRLLFKDRLTKACENSLRCNHQTALIFVDLDRFKLINDTLGHSYGDMLLKNVADRLAESVRKSDTVARLGGDEFVVILQNLQGTEDCSFIAQKLIDNIRRPMTIYEREIQITASLGIALLPTHADSVEGLIQKADAAMYKIKQKGRDAFLLYSEEFNNGICERHELETGLKTALENQELHIVYQPQIHLAENEVIGVEALLRWKHPTHGEISPAKFIPIAEETGMINAIGEWVLRSACTQHRQWLDQGLPPIRIAVNISAKQFHLEEFSSTVQAIIDETGISAEYLEMELTESTMMCHKDQTLITLDKLRALGIKLAIDDFGTGYSSLSYLRKLPIDKIKIDQSFIRNITTTPANEAIVKAILALSENLGMSITAEGIETEDELQFMKNHACHEVQGYHFSKPIEPAEFTSWFRRFGNY